MNTDVEAFVNRNHDCVTNTATDNHKAHRMTLLRRCLAFVAVAAASIVLQIVGQMGAILATSLFLVCLGCSTFFLGQYMETRRK